MSTAACRPAGTCGRRAVLGRGAAGTAAQGSICRFAGAEEGARLCQSTAMIPPADSNTHLGGLPPSLCTPLLAPFPLPHLWKGVEAQLAAVPLPPAGVQVPDGSHSPAVHCCVGVRVHGEAPPLACTHSRGGASSCADMQLEGGWEASQWQQANRRKLATCPQQQVCSGTVEEGKGRAAGFRPPHPHSTEA